MEPETLIAAGTAIDVADGSQPPEWVELVPAGRIVARPHDGRTFELGDPQAVIAASRQLGSDWVVDFDHATDLVKSAPGIAPAAGWIKALEARAGAIWGRVEWTEKGRAALQAKEHRFISPVFTHDKAGKVIRLLRAGLTNDPAFHMTALAHAGAGDEGKTMDELLKALAAALGLPENSDADAVKKTVGELKAAAAATATAMAAITKAAGLDDKAKPSDVAARVGEIVAAATAKATDKTVDETKFVPREQHDLVVARLDALEKSGTEEKATAAVDKAIADGKVIPAQKEWALGYARKDLAGFVAYAAAQPVIVRDGELVTGAVPAGGAGGMTAEAKSVAAAMGITEEAWKKAAEKEAA
ncbi:MAG: phage protease [Alphaproteobacteria bacterium]